MKVLITFPCSATVIIQYGIKSWAIWEWEPSKFQSNYDDKEICQIYWRSSENKYEKRWHLFIKAGDLVKFPAGLYCE